MPSSERLQLPDFGLPANNMPDIWYKGSLHVNTVSLLRYPNAIFDWLGNSDNQGEEHDGDGRLDC